MRLYYSRDISMARSHSVACLPTGKATIRRRHPVSSKAAVQPCPGTGCYGDFKRAFGLLPGAGCTYPTNLQRTPSIFLPFSNLVERHDMTSPLAASSNIWMRTFASEKPVAIAISESSLSPCIFRYCKISFMDSFPETSVVWREVYTY